MLVILFLVIACLAIGLGLHYKRRHDVKTKSRSRHNLLMTSSPGDKPSGDPYLELAAKQQQSVDYMPPQYSEIASDHYGSHRTAAAAASAASAGGRSKFGHRSELSEKSHRSASSGRGSVEEEEDEDAEIQMINEGSCYMTGGGGSSHYATAAGQAEGNDEDGRDDEDAGTAVNNTEEYLAR